MVLFNYFLTGFKKYKTLKMYVICFFKSLCMDNKFIPSANKYPPDNPVVFHSRAEISPLLPAACITGECGPPLASFTCYP